MIGVQIIKIPNNQVYFGGQMRIKVDKRGYNLYPHIPLTVFCVAENVYYIVVFTIKFK